MDLREIILDTGCWQKGIAKYVCLYGIVFHTCESPCHSDFERWYSYLMRVADPMLPPPTNITREW